MLNMDKHAPIFIITKQSYTSYFPKKYTHLNLLLTCQNGALLVLWSLHTFGTWEMHTCFCSLLSFAFSFANRITSCSNSSARACFLALDRAADSRFFINRRNFSVCSGGEVVSGVKLCCGGFGFGLVHGSWWMGLVVVSRVNMVVVDGGGGRKWSVVPVGRGDGAKKFWRR